MITDTMTTEELLANIRKDMVKIYNPKVLGVLINPYRKDAARRKFTYQVYKDIKKIEVNRNRYYIVCGKDEEFFFNIFFICSNKILRIDISHTNEMCLTIFTKHYLNRFRERCPLASDNGILINLSKELLEHSIVDPEKPYFASQNGLNVFKFEKHVQIAVTFIAGDFSDKKYEDFLKLKELNELYGK